MQKCLITGCEGFVGSHLADLLVAEGLSVSAMVYGSTGNIDHLKGKIEILQCDLKNRNRVDEIIRQVRPDYVFHLAAQSFVTVSWEDPEETLKTNALGTFYLFESIRNLSLDPVIEIIGSSSIYGPCAESDMPLTEDRPFHPTSMYAVSKVAEDTLAYFYWKVYGMKTIRVRPFNMTGPRKVGDACADFSRAIVEIEKGHRKILEIGNLATVRDFTDGRDAVKAMWLLARKGLPGEVYSLCSGRGRRMDEVLDRLISLSGRDIKHSVVDNKIRPFDDPIYVGDNTKLRTLGWCLEKSFENTLSDMLDYWRTVIS
jgi:GDP-4-dehydro-6-deoxy-D-mannose reductase